MMDVMLMRDKINGDDFRVEALDEDGGREVAMFSGPGAREWACVSAGLAMAATAYWAPCPNRQAQTTSGSGETTVSSSDRESRIRERAYKLWQENGCPHGRDADFWEQAEDLVGMEENPEAGLLPNPSNRDPALIGVEEAAIQENYGEVPGRLTDQGDRPQTPSKRSAEAAT